MASLKRQKSRVLAISSTLHRQQADERGKEINGGRFHIQFLGYNNKALAKIFATAVRTQMNATHAQLNKKLPMDDIFTISTFSERRVFLNNNSIEFHKIWREDTSDSEQVKDWKMFEI